MAAALSDPGLSLSYVNALAIGKRSRGAAIGLLFYDHVISLDQEIDLVWTRGSKKRPAFYLYIFNRFFALAYYIWNCIPLHPDGLTTSRNCAIFLMCDGIVTTLATLAVQIILQLRIYALYEGNRKILTALLVMCAAEVAAMASLVAWTMSHLRHLTIDTTNNGCAYQGLLSLSSLFFLPALVYEPILFLFVAYKAWGPWTNTHRVPLLTLMARDSLVYFIVIFAQLLVSVVVWAKAPEYINIVNPWSAALPSLIGSRLMLSMREGAYRQGDLDYIMEGYESSSATKDVVPLDHLCMPSATFDSHRSRFSCDEL